MKSIREYINCAVNEGLVFVGVERRAKHDFIVVKNGAGAIYRQPVSRGNTSDRSRLHQALRSNFRKHALATRPHPGRFNTNQLAM